VFLKKYLEKSSIYLSFAGLSWRQNGGFVIQAWDIQSAIEAQHQRAFFQCLEFARGILLSAIDEINRASDIEEVYMDKVEDQGNELIKLLNITETKLRKFFRAEPKNEKEVQDQLENLLVASDFEYTREKEHIYILQKLIYLISF
jgi:hypothetical protein